MPTQFLYIIDILGTISFAISGALLAMEKKLDPFGVLVLSFVTAIGGGTLRDIMVGNTPVLWMQNETRTTIILITALVSMLFAKYVKKIPITLLLFDALGLGLFTIVGIELGMEKQLSPGICIALGTITACFGGVIRDVLLNNVPLLFRKEIYAMACILGGTLYFLLKKFSTLDIDATHSICIVAICVIRIVSYSYKLSLPLIYQKTNKPG